MPHLVQGRLNWQWKLNKQTPKTLELLPLEVTKAHLMMSLNIEDPLLLVGKSLGHTSSISQNGIVLAFAPIEDMFVAL